MVQYLVHILMMARRKKLRQRGANINVNQDRKDIDDSSTIVSRLQCAFVQASVVGKALDLSLRVQSKVSGCREEIFKAFIHGTVTCCIVSANRQSLEEKDGCSVGSGNSPKQQTSITLTVTATETISDCDVCYSSSKDSVTKSIADVCKLGDKPQAETRRTTPAYEAESKTLASGRRKWFALRPKSKEKLRRESDILDDDGASLPEEDVFSFESSLKSNEELVIPHKETKGNKSCNTCGGMKNCVGKQQLSCQCGEMSQKCEVCSLTFESKKELQDHKKMVHNLHLCAICGVAFKMKAVLARHIKTHKGKKDLKCDLCEKAFSDPLSLKIHTRIHTGERPYQCDVCGKTYTDSSSLRNHRKHHMEPENKCEICNKTFVDRIYLKSHQAIHTGKRPYACSVCNAGCLTKSHLKRHMRIHTGSKSHICEVCSKSFFDAKDLAAHKYVHTVDKPFKCTVCEKGYTLRSSLNKHLLVHSDIKPFRCDTCRKEFVTELQYRCHIKIHSNDRKFICELCGKRFLTVSALRSHNVTHKGEKRHKCDKCGKQYRSSWYLQVHKKTHTGEDLIQCHSCGDWFTDPSYFKLHQKKFCKGILEYCNVCKRGFPNNRDLKSHLGIHTGERPFGCETCGKAFAKPEALSEHVKRHSSRASYRCKICGKGFINSNELKKHEGRHGKKKLKASLPDYMKPGHCDAAATDLNIQESDAPLVSLTGVSSGGDLNPVTHIVDEHVGCYLVEPLDIQAHGKEQTHGHETHDVRLFSNPDFKARPMFDLTQPEVGVGQSCLTYSSMLPPQNVHLQPDRDSHILMGDQTFYSIPQYSDIASVSIQQQLL